MPDEKLEKMLPKPPGWEKRRWAVSYFQGGFTIQIMREYSDGWWGGSHKRVDAADVTGDVDEARALIVKAAQAILDEEAARKAEAAKPKLEDLSGNYTT